jgi:hypothetical protein
MQKTILLFIGFIVLCKISYSQVTEGETKLRTLSVDTTFKGWKKAGVFSANLAQTSLTNWSAGGENSISASSFLYVFANYKKPNSYWDNSLDLGYGFLAQGKSDFIKTDDKIDLLSKFGQKAKDNLYYTALFNFKTQMAPGYKTIDDSVLISNLFAPAYFIGALGLDYKPTSNLSLFFAPATTKYTIVNDQRLADSGSYGVTPATFDANKVILTHGEKTRFEFGGYMRLIFTKSEFKSEFLKNLSFTSKLDLFSNYILEPQNIDVNWENLIVMNVNKYIVVSISTQLIYDNDVQIEVDTNEDGIIDKKGPRIQFKELLGVGLAYKF